MANEHPIICLISSYKEGALIQGAIRSAFGFCKTIYVCEGLTEPTEVEGEETNLGDYSPDRAVGGLGDIRYHSGRWKLESDKRTGMIRAAKRDFGSEDFWILTLDADEVLVWGENLRDYL